MCLKNAFCKIYVTIYGRFCLNERGVAGYVNRMKVKYTTKWGVQIAGMIFQTLWSTHHKKSSGRGHRNFFCAIISLYGRYPEYVAVIYISIKQLIYDKISAEQIKDGFWFRFFPGYRLWLSEVK